MIEWIERHADLVRRVALFAACAATVAAAFEPRLLLGAAAIAVTVALSYLIEFAADLAATAERGYDEER